MNIRGPRQWRIRFRVLIILPKYTPPSLSPLSIKQCYIKLFLRVLQHFLPFVNIHHLFLAFYCVSIWGRDYYFLNVYSCCQMAGIPKHHSIQIIYNNSSSSVPSYPRPPIKCIIKFPANAAKSLVPVNFK